MKKLYTLLLAMAVMPLMAQITIDDFENNPRTWENVSCSSGITNNSHQEGLNLSCKCLQLVRTPGCDNWSGALTRFATPYSGYKYLHALMYRNNTGQPNVKVTDNGANLDITPTTTIVANQWQDVVFDISAMGSIDFVFFMADRNDLTEDAVVLIDDIILSNDATPRNAPNTACEAMEQPVDEDGYQLVWNADFVTDQLPACWNIEVNGDGGGNNELQYYCAKGVSLGKDPKEGKHCLILTATKEDYNGKKCTSGRVNTKGKMYYTFGKIEARIMFPNTANGLWPAFWQMGNNFDQVGWPKCGETDIIELGRQNAFSKGTQDRYFNGAMHVGRRWDAVWSEANSVTWSYSVTESFHVLTMIWTPTSIDMYMDIDRNPNPYFHANLEPNDDADYDRSVIFGKPNFLIANLAIGGNFPGIFDIDKITALADGPRSMYIDWIRIYQRGDAGESFVSNVASEEIELDPTAVEDTRAEQQVEKICIDGKIYIRHAGALYDILGNQIR